MSKAKKISKGYRLKPKTHQMVKEIQRHLKGTADDAINKACEKLLEGMKKTGNNNLKFNK